MSSLIGSPDRISCGFRVMSRALFLGIVARIPHIDDSERSVRQAIGNTLNNLLGYPHGREHEWSRWISVSPVAVEQVESSFFENTGLFPPGAAEFDSAFLMRGIAHEWHACGRLTLERAFA